MAGYNHYASCTCGWCRHENGNSISLGAALRAYEYESSLRILRDTGAERSRAACFVNPNASCPVCGAVVFFYQNAHGSRVFFDELGPPWPKHPCTDVSSKQLSNGWVRGTSFEKRKLGKTKEILDALKTVGLDWRQQYERRYGYPPPSLYQVDEVRFKGFDNLMLISALDTLSFTNQNEEQLYAKYTSPKVRPEVGEVIAFDHSKIWIFDKVNLKGRSFAAECISREAFLRGTEA